MITQLIPLQSNDTPGLLPVSTTVLWTSCLTVGLIGLLLPPDRSPPPAQVKPIDAELLTVETAVQQRPAQTSAPPAPSPPPAPPALPAPPDPAPFTEPAPVPARPLATPQPPPANPPVIQLTYGQGEGQQPAPEYPPEAVIDGQEGTVVVCLTVNQEGLVSDAAVAAPSRWPLLNSAALRAVRDSWRFKTGPPRTYEVSIQFQLNRHE